MSFAHPRRHPMVGAPSRRSGLVMVYTVTTLVALTGIVTLAVDYGHVQSVRAEMQRSAESAARGWIDLIFYGHNPAATATGYTTYLAQSVYNPIDGPSGVTCTVSITPGTWDPVTSTFTANSSSTTAVQVKISRTAAAGNSVPLFWGKVLGQKSCDVHAMATVAITGGQSASLAVPRNANPYLAGMPTGTTISGGWGDNTSSATPYQMGGIPVVPGTYISVSSVTGSSSIFPGTVDTTGPDGDTSLILHHGQNYNSSPNPPFPNPENGIGDAKIPADALTGLFLTNAPPDHNTAPAAVDWTDAAHANQARYTNIVPQQPFLIGNGTTTGGTTQQFLVPPGATRMFLGVWDGVCYNNNSGGLSGTINVGQKVMMVQAQ